MGPGYGAKCPGSPGYKALHDAHELKIASLQCLDRIASALERIAAKPPGGA